jgi:hypothetical protein
MYYNKSKLIGKLNENLSLTKQKRRNNFFLKKFISRSFSVLKYVSKIVFNYNKHKLRIGKFNFLKKTTNTVKLVSATFLKKGFKNFYKNRIKYFRFKKFFNYAVVDHFQSKNFNRDYYKLLKNYSHHFIKLNYNTKINNNSRCIQLLDTQYYSH